MARDETWYQRNSQTTNLRIPSKSGPDCFSPVADKTTRDARAVCAKCGQKAIGAEFLSFQGPESFDVMYAMVRFSCGCDGRKSFAISADSLFPQWELLFMVEPGVWKISKVPVKKRIELCSQE